MSQSNLLISGERRLATELRTRSQDGVPYDEHFQHVVPTQLGAVAKLLSRYLATSGGSVEMAVASGTFDLAPTSSEVYRVSRVSFLLACSTAIAMTSLGDLAALATGIKLEWRNGSGVVVDLLGGQPFKTLNDLAAVAEIDVRELGSSHTVRGAIDLPTPVRLDGGAGELLRVTVADNLSTLVRLRCHAFGAVEELT